VIIGVYRSDFRSRRAAPGCKQGAEAGSGSDLVIGNYLKEFTISTANPQKGGGVDSKVTGALPSAATGANFDSNVKDHRRAFGNHPNARHSRRGVSHIGFQLSNVVWWYGAIYFLPMS